MSKCLCTGGAGFIGSHLVDKLIELGHDVVVLDDCSTGFVNNVNKKATLIIHSINDSLTHIFDAHKFDYVFHLAAQINLRKSFEQPIMDARTNVLGSLNVIQNSIRTGVKKLIFSSTGGAIYSKEESLPWAESTAACPESPYGLGKLMVENYLRIFKELDSAILRYSNVYGPRQNAKGEAGVAAIFLENAFEGKTLRIFGSGEQTRDFIFVDDVVSANLHVLKKDLSGIFNVSTGMEISVSEVAQVIAGISKLRIAVENLPPVPGELLHTKLSCDKLRLTGWAPMVCFSDGVKKTWDYQRSLNVI